MERSRRMLLTQKDGEIVIVGKKGKTQQTEGFAWEQKKIKNRVRSRSVKGGTFQIS